MNASNRGSLSVSLPVSLPSELPGWPCLVARASTGRGSQLVQIGAYTVNKAESRHTFRASVAAAWGNQSFQLLLLLLRLRTAPRLLRLSLALARLGLTAFLPLCLSSLADALVRPLCHSLSYSFFLPPPSRSPQLRVDTPGPINPKSGSTWGPHRDSPPPNKRQRLLTERERRQGTKTGRVAPLSLASIPGHRRWRCCFLLFAYFQPPLFLLPFCQMPPFSYTPFTFPIFLHFLSPLSLVLSISLSLALPLSLCLRVPLCRRFVHVTTEYVPCALRPGSRRASHAAGQVWPGQACQTRQTASARLEYD